MRFRRWEYGVGVGVIEERVRCECLRCWIGLVRADWFLFCVSMSGIHVIVLYRRRRRACQTSVGFQAESTTDIE